MQPLNHSKQRDNPWLAERFVSTILGVEFSGKWLAKSLRQVVYVCWAFVPCKEWTLVFT